jgi:beta-phosphoglucomutase-like phosphatase (HAD superfamily)
MFRAVLFDIVGTLVNSNDAHARAWVKHSIPPSPFP